MPLQKRQLQRQSVFEEAALLQLLSELSLKPIHVASIWKFVLSHPSTPLSAIPHLPSSLYPHLSSSFLLPSSSLVSRSDSLDGLTSKLLLKLQDGHAVECVVMRHDPSQGRYRGGERGGSPRATLCVSSQVGCQMGCTFCATGTMGLIANLTAGEIIEQLFHALQVAPIRNIVFMGMGEPLNNYSQVKQAVLSLTSHSCFALSPSHITVSTVGIVPRMLTFASDMPGVHLALSLHAASQTKRVAIVPSARAYNLDKIMAAMDAFQAASGSSVLLEYVMLGGVNDSEEDAHQLGELLRNKNVVLNLIPYNPTSVTFDFQASPHENVTKFQSIVRGTYGVRTTVRREMGQDIAGACGQLALQAKEPSSRCGIGVKTIMDIEDLPARA